MKKTLKFLIKLIFYDEIFKKPQATIKGQLFKKNFSIFLAPKLK